jgi:aspartate-semialdehyde dehydrogenase
MRENQIRKRIEVGILGATGIVGQQFMVFLEGHPWFEVKWVGASDRSAGRKYREAAHWRLPGDAPDSVARLTVEECKPGNAPRLIFSAMDSSVATEIEREFARAGHFVVSNSKNHRMEPDVPLLVPEINPGHLQLLPRQKNERGWSGQIVTNPNCSTVVLSMALAPVKVFGIASVVVTTMQAISGAGYPGVPSMDITNNVIPFIGEEEQKIERETQKILGEFGSGEIQPLAAGISAHCNRVPVVNGHMVMVSVAFTSKPAEADVLAAFDSFSGIPQQRRLPSAPAMPILYLPECDRPQPRRDAERERGMTVTVGRLRTCPVMDYKFIALGHNTIRGAAGAAVLNAELIHSEGLLDR